MRGRRIAWLALLLTTFLVAAACGNGGDESEEAETEEGGTITVGGMEANDHGSADVAGDSQVELEADDFYFEPTVLSGEAGQTLTVEVMNEGDATHTFTLEEQGVDLQLAPGESGEAEVTFPDSGALVFICRFHSGQGMRGGLSVGGDLEPAAASEGGNSENGVY
jgi:plastocyanin